MLNGAKGKAEVLVTFIVVSDAVQGVVRVVLVATIWAGLVGPKAPQGFIITVPPVPSKIDVPNTSAFTPGKDLINNRPRETHDSCGRREELEPRKGGASVHGMLDDNKQ
jgi:hypothetical protein